MSEFQPVATKADLEQLDDADMVAGYMAGFRGDSEPGNAFSRSFWHGWRNGMVDSRRAEMDCAQRRLVRELTGYRHVH